MAALLPEPGAPSGYPPGMESGAMELKQSRVRAAVRIGQYTSAA